MSRLVHLKKIMDNLCEDIFSARIAAEQQRQIEYAAVVRVQAWFRGWLTRKRIRLLHDHALLIQKIYRGLRGRRRFFKVVEELYEQECQNYYDRCATRIQSLWRGYYTRKHVFNYYSFKEYLLVVQSKNRQILDAMNEYRKEQNEKHASEMKELEARKKQRWAEKHRHMLSTRQKDGVFKSRAEVEQVLKEIKPEINPRGLEHQHRRYSSFEQLDDQTCRPYMLYESVPLPPINCSKPQGPFRDSAEVYLQRFRPLSPTLRVATDFFGIEKSRRRLRSEQWATQLHDHPMHFNPTSKSYQQELNSKLPYLVPPYTYRTKHPERHVSMIDFRCIVPPIQQFSKYKRLYRDDDPVLCDEVESKKVLLKL